MEIEINIDGRPPHGGSEREARRYTCAGHRHGHCGVSHGTPEDAGRCCRRDDKLRSDGVSDRSLKLVDDHEDPSDEEWSRFVDARYGLA